MKIQFGRIHIERLLKNTPDGKMICIDTEAKSISIADKIGRETGAVKVPMVVRNDSK